VGGERFPRRLVAATLERSDDPAVRVHDDDVRLIFGAEAAGTYPLGVSDGRPGPAEPLDEGSCLVSGVGDVQPDVRELRVLLLKLGIGDRLALARSSPRRPHVHEHGSAAERDE
jgi:hypothetical protein